MALPVVLSSFVGRQAEVAELRELLRTTRLLTLTGAGGVGKTRLAIAVAQDEPMAEDQVAFVDLTPIGEPDLVPSVVASRLEIAEQPDQPPEEALASGLQGRRLLLLLDNCEHLVEGCARLASALLRSCPELQILVTSRQPLGVDGELTWRVPSLPLEDAVRLFQERARARRGRPGDDEPREVADLCRRLDGIPLAIELAAGRANVLTARQIAERLDDRFRLLVSGSRTAPARHQTLRATIDWSYESLDDDERCLFDQVSVFSGGWTLDAAEAVSTSRAATLDVLGRLVDKSLVLAEASPRVEGQSSGEMRFRMLETLGEYGRQQLAASGAEEEARRRHFEHFLSHSAAAFATRLRTGSGGPLRDLYADLDNIRAALSWSRDADPCSGLRLVGATRELWYRLSQLEGLRWCKYFLERCREVGPARGWALVALAYLANTQRLFAEAQRAAREALSIGRTDGDLGIESWAAYFLGLSGFLSRDPDAAREWLPESIRLFERTGDRLGHGWALASSGTVEYLQGRWDNAVRLLEDALRVLLPVGDEWGMGLCRTYLGYVALARGDQGRAEGHFRTAVEVLAPIKDVTMLTMALVGLGEVLAAADPLRAATITAAAVALRERLGGPLLPFAAAAVERIRARAATALGQVPADLAWESGRMLEADQAVTLALASRPRPDGPLTPREREVARLVARGLRNAQIADELVIALPTVERHVSNILGKLGLDSRAQLVAWVLSRESG